MKITQATPTAITITDIGHLDPIYVYTEDHEPGKGRITIACFDRAWTSRWGGMGDRTVARFFATSHPDYLSECLLNSEGQLKSAKKHSTAHLIHVIKAVQRAFDILELEARDGG